jgi:hypothetical protein
MLHLPYLRDPYDDETLGSWLQGLRLHNGAGAWRCLLEAVGYGRRIEGPLFITAAHNEKLAALLDFLGTTYESAVLNLTTIPYWLAFDSLSLAQGALPGTHNLPKLPRRKTYGRFVKRAQLDRHAPRWCPMCLIDDCTKYGEPYWHRSHQLPNTFACWRHHCALRINCPSCGWATPTPVKELMSLPGMGLPHFW